MVLYGWYVTTSPSSLPRRVKVKGYVGASASRLFEGVPLELPKVKVKVKGEAAAKPHLPYPPIPPQGGATATSGPEVPL